MLPALFAPASCRRPSRKPEGAHVFLNSQAAIPLPLPLLRPSSPKLTATATTLPHTSNYPQTVYRKRPQCLQRPCSAPFGPTPPPSTGTVRTAVRYYPSGRVRGVSSVGRDIKWWFTSQTPYSFVELFKVSTIRQRYIRTVQKMPSLDHGDRSTLDTRNAAHTPKTRSPVQHVEPGSGYHSTFQDIPSQCNHSIRVVDFLWWSLRPSRRCK